jgi:glycosyltransferase involved in cell wall biosynthesis
MEPFRRLPEVIGYISELRDAGKSDVYLLLVGDGQDMHEIQRVIEVSSASLKKSVKCVGWVEHSEISKYLSALDLAVFPFTNDYCSPLKLFEYLGAGLPTIGPKTSAVTEVFEDSVHLKLIEQDGSNFKSAVLELKDNEDLRTQLAHNGQQLVLENYTWEKNAERVLEHVESLRIEQ